MGRAEARAEGGVSWQTHRGLSTRFYGLDPERHIEVDAFGGEFRWRLFEGPKLVRRGAEYSRRTAQTRAHKAALALGWEVVP